MHVVDKSSSSQSHFMSFHHAGIHILSIPVRNDTTIGISCRGFHVFHLQNFAILGLDKDTTTTCSRLVVGRFGGRNSQKGNSIIGLFQSIGKRLGCGQRFSKLAPQFFDGLRSRGGVFLAGGKLFDQSRQGPVGASDSLLCCRHGLILVLDAVQRLG